MRKPPSLRQQRQRAYSALLMQLKGNASLHIAGEQAKLLAEFPSASAAVHKAKLVMQEAVADVQRAFIAEFPHPPESKHSREAGHSRVLTLSKQTRKPVKEEK